METYRSTSHYLENLDGRCLPLGSEDLHEKGTSDAIGELFRARFAKGYNRDALQLSIQVDEITLYFWLPEELEHVAEILSRKPLPTVRTLTKTEISETRLNTHWLSRLPAKAKTPKWRGKFIGYVQSNPKALQDWRAFYSEAHA